MSDTHEEITSRMNDKREREAIELACKILEKKSGEKNIILLPFSKKIAGTKEEIEIYSDNGDIIIISKDLKTVQAVEVKRLSDTNFMSHFTDRKSWTLPNFIVDGVWQIQNKKIKVYLYMCFNANLTHLAAIYPHKTIEHWKIENKNGNGSKKDYYVVDPDLIEFKKVEDLLNG